MQNIMFVRFEVARNEMHKLHVAVVKSVFHTLFCQPRFPCYTMAGKTWLEKIPLPPAGNAVIKRKMFWFLDNLFHRAYVSHLMAEDAFSLSTFSTYKSVCTGTRYRQCTCVSYKAIVTTISRLWFVICSFSAVALNASGNDFLDNFKFSAIIAILVLEKFKWKRWNSAIVNTNNVTLFRYDI